LRVRVEGKDFTSSFTVSSNFCVHDLHIKPKIGQTHGERESKDRTRPRRSGRFRIHEPLELAVVAVLLPH
jgi:hypothetical protein